MPRPTAKFSVDEVLAYQPCKEYTRERLEVLFKGKAKVGIDEVLDADIPPEHKVDCLLRSGLVNPSLQRKFLEFIRGLMVPDGDDDVNYKQAFDDEFAVADAAICQQANTMKGDDPVERRAAVSAAGEQQLAFLLGLIDG